MQKLLRLKFSEYNQQGWPKVFGKFVPGFFKFFLGLKQKQFLSPLLVGI